MTPPIFRPAGAGALLADFGGAIDEAVFARVVALDRALAHAAPPGLIETVPAYTSLLLVFDPLATDHAAIEALAAPHAAAPAADFANVATHEVPVCYDCADAPDLAAVAERLAMPPEAVIAAHLAGDYRVFMYGFAPGYAYLGGVPEALHLPRKPAAVRGHPLGSVMIAGPQCLITTLPMPTGWWVIGRTPLRVLDAAAEKPFRFEPGDRVRFTRIAAA
ncbi:5-oxoprolinase subunit B family protein [Sphingomonas radiodurans]|uniref:5-oxoprolinase subunit B family protein n=1 Tax=Sphingomonas radiodurans TaxID=2890321 RepID=UPI001E37E876|nr:allophanate hydrolase subunit 1 [Sphingomonas radiodurans]WBH16257.1 allophanate hydrolase subunit 1 [Sphingomonas radiodurans]